MKRTIPFIIIVAVGLVTVGSGALIYQSKRARIESTSTFGGTQN